VGAPRAGSPPTTVDLGGAARAGTTYLIDLDPVFEVKGPVAFPGVRLPELASAVRACEEARDCWHDDELAALSALEAGGECSALTRPGSWQARDEELAAERAGAGPGGALSLVHPGGHVAQMCVRVDEHVGYRQWFLFDDVWASAHPHLAESLVHYAAHWDPGCARRHPLRAPCGDGAYLDLVFADGKMVRDREPYDEPEILALIEAVEHAESAALRQSEEGTRVLVILDNLREEGVPRAVIGAVAVRLHDPAPGMCDVRAFVIHPDHRGRRIGVRAALRLWHELRAEGIDRVTFTMPHGRGGREMARDLAALTGDERPGSRVEVPLSRLRAEVNLPWWARSVAELKGDV
jgi:N-acetylglutamate synthase-like GNAT family acetyltransferase